MLGGLSSLRVSEKVNPVHISMSLFWFIYADHGIPFLLAKNLVREGHWTKFWPREYEGVAFCRRPRKVSSLREIDTRGRTPLVS